MTDRSKTLQDQTEDNISEARELFCAIYDEDMPDITDAVTRQSVQKRTDQGMHMLDDASDRLQELGFAFHNILDKRDELAEENEALITQVAAVSFVRLAEDLLHELRGRMMTDDPTTVVRWVEAALTEVLRHDTPEDEDDAAAIVYGATNAFVGVTS